jgi:twitching motility protein PilU
MEQSLAQGSQTFEQALYDLYLNGEITLDEAMTNSDSPTNLHWLINNSGKLVRPQDTSRSVPDPVSDPQSSDLSSIKLNLDIM